MIPLRPRDINPLSLAKLHRHAEMYALRIASLEAQPDCDQQELEDWYELLERTLEDIDGAAPDPQLAPGTAICSVLTRLVRCGERVIARDNAHLLLCASDCDCSRHCSSAAPRRCRAAGELLS